MQTNELMFDRPDPPTPPSNNQFHYPFYKFPGGFGVPCVTVPRHFCCYVPGENVEDVVCLVEDMMLVVEGGEEALLVGFGGAVEGEEREGVDRGQRAHVDE